ncbi:reverse transcriptase domain-containing protein [Runella sp.]|uniref:reverse transcriptase domain-containing protein n=1 Tax=Runella sp. TaxID=1960881 RepID=UPI003D0C1024
MILTTEQKDIIQASFAKMQTKEDLIDLLNHAKSILYPSKSDKEPKPIRLKSISFYADYRLSSNKRYRHFTIKKKNGKERQIAAPASGLKLIQRCLNLIFGAIYEPKSYVTGFVNEKSIVDNANIHVGKRYVFNIDLQDFFPSITVYRIKAVLGIEPFNLINDRDFLAFTISNLCCIENPQNKAVLPQGAPTSPILSNIASQKLDRRLNGLAKKVGCKYSRYADDITFSADMDIFNLEFKTEMRKIIEE